MRNKPTTQKRSQKPPHAPSPEKNSICAVIVTYQPDEGLPTRIERILKQVDRVVIVDNGSAEICMKMLHDACAHYDCILIANDRNMGIATALNQGIEYARSRGYEWVLTLDDDSLPTETMIREMIAVYNACADREAIGIIGANPTDNYSARSPYEEQCKGRLWIDQSVIISSGCLIPVRSFEKTGPLRDDFFIDCVDQEYCLRLRASGYRVIVACHAKMMHSLGQPRMHIFLGRQFMPTNHDYVRHYYITRNTLVLAREHLFNEPKWVMRSIVGLFKSIIKMILFERDKMKKVTGTVTGSWHALVGKMGQYSVSDSRRGQSNS